MAAPADGFHPRPEIMSALSNRTHIKIVIMSAASRFSDGPARLFCAAQTRPDAALPKERRYLRRNAAE